MRCLAYADCNWYPEAEAALITALRTDRNECVRDEAASVLGSGCCCTRKIIEALAISASGSKKDGNPPENSLRVKAAAYISLQHCLNCYVQVEELNPLEQPEKPERLPDPKVLPPGTTAFEPIQPTVALRPVPVTVDPLIAEARSVLAESKVHAVEPSPIMTTGHRSLYDAFVRASNPPSKPAAAAGYSVCGTADAAEAAAAQRVQWFAGRKTVARPPPVAEPVNARFAPTAGAGAVAGYGTTNDGLSGRCSSTVTEYARAVGVPPSGGTTLNRLMTVDEQDRYGESAR